LLGETTPGAGLLLTVPQKALKLESGEFKPMGCPNVLSHRVVLILALFAPCTTVAGGEVSAWAALNTTIPPALCYLEEEALSWKAEMGCASCHHAPIILWSCETAKAKGFTVNEEAVAATPESIATAERSKVWLAQPLEKPSHQQEVTQCIAKWATGAPQATLDLRQALLLAQPRPDGRWARPWQRGRLYRPRQGWEAPGRSGGDAGGSGAVGGVVTGRHDVHQLGV
jgi:hypothetical protein